MRSLPRGNTTNGLARGERLRSVPRNETRMNVDPEMVVLIGKILAVNIGAALLLAVLSYAWSVLSLNALGYLDRWLDPSKTPSARAEDLRPS